MAFTMGRAGEAVVGVTADEGGRETNVRWGAEGRGDIGLELEVGRVVFMAVVVSDVEVSMETEVVGRTGAAAADAGVESAITWLTANTIS